MPDALARLSVQRDQRVGEKIVADPVGAVEIKCSRAGRNIDNSARSVHGHTGPVIGCAAGLPGIFRPSFVANFAWAWNGVEFPAQLAGSHIIGADVAVGRGQSFRFAAADDHQIFVNYCRAGYVNGLRGRIAVQILAQIDAAVSIFSESCDGFAGRGIERVNEVHYADQNCAVASGRPISQSAIGLRAPDSGIERPYQLACRRIQGEHFLRRSQPVEHAVHDNWTGLQAAGFLRVERPGDLKASDVLTINLGQARIMVVFRRSAVDGPVASPFFIGGFA